MSNTRVELGGMSANKIRDNLKLRTRSVFPTWRSSVSPVAKLGRDGELPLASDLHAHDPEVPALDHLPRTQLELERLPSVEAVELLVVGLQPA